MFSPGVEPASLGDYVWYDADENGVQDPGETGVSGVTVRLIDPVTGDIIATTGTDTTGFYEFTGLAPGDYAVSFALPSGYTFTSADAGANDALDSDANVSTGRTDAITLAAGEHNPTLDAGIFVDDTQPASLGDYVWHDTNEDGVQDTGEPGISGVTVRLIDPATGYGLDTTTTDGSGYYGFTGLAPGDYAVEFDLPTDYQFTAQDNGPDDVFDSDADITTGRTQTVTFAAGDDNRTWMRGCLVRVSSPPVWAIMSGMTRTRTVCKTPERPVSQASRSG